MIKLKYVALTIGLLVGLSFVAYPTAQFVTAGGGGGGSFPLRASTSLDNQTTTPQYSFSTATNTGINYNFGSIIAVFSGSRKIDMQSTTFGLLDDTQLVQMGSGGDTGFERISAGIVTFNNGSRGGAGAVGIGATAFASLGTPANGTFKFCNDCTIANPCAAAGTGAFAKRLNGVWVCN